MNRKTLSFIALAITILYGAGFAVFSPVPGGYPAGGGAVVALMWIAVGVFGKDESAARPAPAAPAAGTTDSTSSPFGTPPQDQP